MSTIQASRISIRHSQAGMVSIMTTMVLMIVISLIVLGFAQLSRRNQRETLDRQLSSQAFYAAESGVNDVRKLIQDELDSGAAIIPEKSGCTDTGTGGFYASLSPTIDASTNVAYTCLLVDPSPETLRYSDIGTTSTVVPLIATSGTIGQINLNWQSKITGSSPNTGCPTTTSAVFTPTSGWGCGYGILRIDLVPTTGSLNMSSLRTNTMTVFAVPQNGTGANSMNYATSTTANNRFGVRCTSTGCSLQIGNLGQSSYYMRVSSIYHSSALQISATSGGSPVELTGAQAVVDATGKAQDVLRRIQVHVPLRASSENQLSDYAIQSTDAICKRFSVMDGYFDSSVNGVTSTNQFCQP